MDLLLHVKIQLLLIQLLQLLIHYKLKEVQKEHHYTNKLTSIHSEQLEEDVSAKEIDTQN